MLKSKKSLGFIVLLIVIHGCSKKHETIENASLVSQISWQIKPIENRFIVQLHESDIVNHAKQFKNNTAIELIIKDFASSIAESNGTDIRPTDLIYSSAIKGFTLTATPEQAEKLKADSRIKFIEPDQAFILAKGGKKNTGNSVEQPAQTTPAGITRVGGSKTVTDKKAWIIDTGIDLDHPDLNVNSRLSTAFLQNTKGKPNPDDGHGHGTHVAGIVGAINNDIGTVGVAQGCELVAVKVLDNNGYGVLSDIIAGIDYVAKFGSAGDVANLSLGFMGSSTLDAAVSNAASMGIFFAIASGNSSTDANNFSPD